MMQTVRLKIGSLHSSSDGWLACLGGPHEGLRGEFLCRDVVLPWMVLFWSRCVNPSRRSLTCEWRGGAIILFMRLRQPRAQHPIPIPPQRPISSRCGHAAISRWPVVSLNTTPVVISLSALLSPTLK